MDFLKRFANKAKLKYGAVLAAFLSIIITIIILLNVLVTSLANRFNWYFDMTDEQLYSVSEEFIKSIDKVEKDVKLEIVFFQDKDIIESDFSSVGGLVGLSYVHTTATQLASRLDNVSVSYRSIDDIAFLNQFIITNNSIRPTKNSVIIMRTKSPGVVDGTQFEILSPEDFYFSASDSSLYAYNGEARIIESAIRLTTNKFPTVYFVYNHGTNNPVSNLRELFENSGMNCDLINLAEKRFTCQCGEVYTESDLRDWNRKNNFVSDEETDVEYDENGKEIFVKGFKCSNEDCLKVPYNVLSESLKDLEKIPDDARAIVIYEPQTDFTDKEIILLENYQKAKGNVMAFLDPDLDKAEMANFYEWLETWGGITINTEGEEYVTDTLNGYGQDKTKIEVDVPKNNATDAFLPGLSTSADTFIIDKAVTITIKATRFEGDNTQTETLPIITTSQNAVFNGKKQPNGHVVMSLSKRGVLLENPDATNIAQDEFSSCLLVCTSGSFVDDSHIIDTQNSNQKVMRALIAATSRAQIFSSNVEFKVFNSYALTITTGEATTIFILSMTLLPLAAIIIGFVVIYRRKRR